MGVSIKKQRHGFLTVLFLIVFVLSGFCLSADAQTEPKKVLLIHSYHPEYPWVASITKGVEAALKGENAELEIFYMDTKRKTSDEWKVQAGKLAREKVDTWQPDAVIAADDNAQIFVTQRYAGQEKPFFVFCGVNGEPSDYGLPASNVTGIVERPHFKESVKYLLEIVPNIRRIAVMSDKGPTSVGALEFMRKQDIGIKVLDYRLIDDFDLWKKRILDYNIDSDAVAIYMYHTVKRAGEIESMPPQEVMAWTIENSSVPTIGFFDFSIIDGMLAGVVESGEEHGYEAAKMALALLAGEDIGNLPVKTAEKGMKMINLKTAAKLKMVIPQEIVESADQVIGQ
ncbi:MAG: hypothetical protein JW893_02915 [Candidatus Omnitrophica bacterium]|nr:hypothetical protein [Candidatus Omnitrophota bacterium]